MHTDDAYARQYFIFARAPTQCTAQLVHVRCRLYVRVRTLPARSVSVRRLHPVRPGQERRVVAVPPIDARARRELLHVNRREHSKSKRQQRRRLDFF